MAEQQFTPTPQEDNQELYTPNVSQLAGYDKELFTDKESADPVKQISVSQRIEPLEDEKINYIGKNAINTLNSVVETSTEKQTIDADGNFDYTDIGDNSMSILASQEMPDPTLEEERKKLINDIKTKRDEEINGLQDEANQKVASGELSPKKIQKYIDKRKKQIDKKHKKELNGAVFDLHDKGGRKKGSTARGFKKMVGDLDNELEIRLKYNNSIGAGSRLSYANMVTANVNKEYEEKHQKTLQNGVSNMAQFQDAWVNGKGNIKEGDVIRAYPFLSIKPRGVYYQAITDKDGKRIVKAVEQAFTDPITGEVLGAYVPPKKTQNVILKPEYAAIVTSKAQFFKSLDEDLANGYKTQAQVDKEKQGFEERRKTAVKKNIEAYNRIMSSDNNSDITKLAVAASVFPNQFKEKYDEFVNAGESNILGSILKYSVGLPAVVAEGVLGRAAMGIEEIVQAFSGLDDVEFPMGTLALEIENNPAIANKMDEVISNSYNRSTMYTSSIEGLAELTKAAKIQVRNKDINTAISVTQSLLPKVKEVFEDFDNYATLTKAEMMNFANGKIEIQKRSGYLDAFNDYVKLNNELINSTNEDERNAYRFIKLKQQILNFDGTASEALASLKKEDLEFINTIGADLTKNRIELLNTVAGKINQLVDLNNKARSLYPSKELAEYDRKNKGKIDKSIEGYNKRREALLNSELFSSRGSAAMDIIESLHDQYDIDDDTWAYSFPLLSRQGLQTPKNAFIYSNPVFGPGLEFILGISNLLRKGESSISLVSQALGMDFDMNRRNISSSLQEYKRYYETQAPETGIYSIDLARKIGGALPHIIGFAASSLLGGPVGAASYLSLTMTGDVMKQAAEAGLQPIDQMLFAALTIGIEYASELITPEASLLGVRRGKSVLTKSLLNRIMNTGTRKEALKEYAGLIWKSSKDLAKQGTIESLENHVSDKANFVLQSMFNSVYATTFEPSVMSFKQSTDDILTTIGTSAIFKGGTAMFRTQKTIESKTKKDIKERGFNDDQASILAAASTPSGLKQLIDYVNEVESGNISSDNINQEMYEFLKNKVIPNAMALQSDIMRLSSDPNISVQQRTVALFNLMQINEINGMVERGEVMAASAETLAQQYNDNAKKALEDKAFADEQFGLDDTGLAQKIKEYFGLADMRVNEEGVLDATPATTTQPAAAVTTTEQLPAESTAQDVKLAEAERNAQEAANQSTNTVDPATLKDQAAAQVQTEAVSEMETTGGTAAVTTSATAQAETTATAATPSDFEIMDRGTLADRIVSIVAAPLRKFKARASKEALIRKNPEKALSMEIFATRAQLDIAQDRYNEVVKSGKLAPIELTEIKILQERLNNLTTLKDNYFKTQQYATEVSEAIRQEIGERRNSVQYPGAQEGQLEEGERERREREATESTANYRNRNFGSQAQAAVQEIGQTPEQPPVVNMYMGSMQPGQEVQLMDEMASQVVIDEPAAVSQFGQAVVDRVKQYINDTNFTTDLPIVRQAMVRQAEQRLGQAIEEANTAIERQNQNTSKQHKKAVVKLVERLKQAFPNVKVFMDKKGFEAAVEDPAARELMTKGGVVYGRILNGDVYLNPDFSNYNTPIHEFGHLWLNVAKELSPNAFNRGLELIRDSEYVRRLDGDPLYDGLTKEELEEEALATAIGDRGEKLILESQRKGFRGWMTRLLRKMAQYVGIMNMSSSELRSLDLDTYLNMVNASLLAGETITANRMEVDERFMAKMDKDVKNVLTRVAQEHFNLAIAKGRDLAEARVEAYTKLSEFAEGKYLGKTGYDEISQGLADIILNVSEAENQRIIQQKKTEKLNQLFQFDKFKEISTIANEEAARLEQGKVNVSDAMEQVTKKVKAEVEKLFAGKQAPAGVSWISAMALAPSIAADAVMAAYPATNRRSLVNEDIITMTSSKYIRNAIFNQINAIKDVEKRAEGIKVAVKEIFKQMSDAYGTGLQLSPSKVNAIIAEIDANVFSREDIMSATEEAANAVSNIIEKEYRKKLIEESAGLLDKLKSKVAKAKYTSDLLDKAMSLLAIDTNSWKNSNATLEDLSQFNTAINKILAGDNVNWHFDFAITKAGDIQIENTTKVKSEYDSLISKMNRMIAKAGNLDLSDYGSIIAFNNAMIDVKDRKGALAAFTPEQIAKIEQKYSEVVASIPGALTIAEIVEQKEAEITNSLKNKADLLKSELESEASDIRMRVKNPLLYHQMISFSKFILQDDYIDSLPTKEKLALINAIENVMMHGNYNFDVYTQYIKAKKYYLKNATINWAKNISKRRKSLASPGFTGLIANKFKNFIGVFTDVEGATPSAQLIADNFDLLRLHSMDVELFSGRGKSGYDMFDMGFLERDIFAPMASGVDGAVNRTQAKLQNLQDAMVLLSDKSNRTVINNALRVIRDKYGLGGNIKFKNIIEGLKRGSLDGYYAQISTRMATIIAHQIDHISNLKEGQEADDMILKRNILDGIIEDKKADYKYMSDRYSKGGDLGVLADNYDAFIDAIAYAVLTDGGTKNLAGLNEQELLDKLTPSQKKAMTSWREFIGANQDLVEASMVIKGNMKGLIKNYFPRRVATLDNIASISDYEGYINSQFENVGLSEGQLLERTGNIGRLDLNGNKVLLNNLKSLHLLNEMKPYIDQIKAINEAVEELKTMAADATDENTKRELNFAAAYAEGVSITIKRRLDNSLLNGDKAINDNFNVFFRLISKTQKFAANMWLISTMRQLGADYPANITKSAAAMAYANKSLKSQLWRLLSPKKSSVRTEKGKFVWDDYVKIAELTGSPVYRTVSIYSDNFLYDYSKTPEQLQRKQKVMSWQDMAVKKQVWMERFENAFTRVTGQVFDHKAFEDERGSYRATYFEAVEMASKAADSTVDRQFGLPSFARQPLRANVLLPIIGRPLRNFLQSFNMKDFFTVSKTSQVSVILGFMMGYPSVQFSLFRNYFKLAFSGTSGLSLKDRSKYLSQAITEAFVPTFIYGLSRSFFGALFTTAAAAIYSAGDDEDKQEEMFKEMEKQDFWDRTLSKFKMEMKKAEDKTLDNLVNSLSANVVDPQTTFLFRTVGGLLLFQLWKKQAILDMDTREMEFQYEYGGQTLTGKRKVTKEERTAMGKKIKEEENKWWNRYNLRPIEIYGGQEYDEAVRKYDIGWAAGSATQGWAELFESVGGFGEVAKTIKSGYSTYDLWMALESGKDVNKDELLAASIMKGYGLIFANFMLGGKYGWVASLLSGDANKLSNTILKDLESRNKRHEREEKKKEKGGGGGGVGTRSTKSRRTGGR